MISKFFFSDTLRYYSQYSYDDNPNPFEMLKGIEIASPHFEKNNFIQIKTFDHLGNLTEEENYIYEYNDQNLPFIRKEIDSNGDIIGMPDLYTYDCD